jgi:hypothetical protein
MSPTSVTLCPDRSQEQCTAEDESLLAEAALNLPPPALKPKTSKPSGRKSSVSAPKIDGHMTVPPLPVLPSDDALLEEDDLELVGAEVSTSITQTWTDQAIKCYKTHADCASCSIPAGNYSFDCQMNKVVPVLVKNLGEPDIHRVKKLLPFLHHYQ